LRPHLLAQKGHLYRLRSLVQGRLDEIQMNLNNEYLDKDSKKELSIQEVTESQRLFLIFHQIKSIEKEML
jgi:hypothetical protein